MKKKKEVTNPQATKAINYNLCKGQLKGNFPLLPCNSVNYASPAAVPNTRPNGSNNKTVIFFVSARTD